MQSIRREGGFMLVMALAIMAILILVGVSGSFLSVANSKDSNNIAQSATVRYQAEAGVDTTVLRLKKDYANWPTWCTATGCTTPAVSGVDNTVTGTTNKVIICPLSTGCGTTYTPPAAGTTGPVIVRSTTTNGSGAEYVAEAVVNKGDPTTPNPIFGQGLVSNGSIDVGSNTQVSTNVWSAGSIGGGGNPIFTNARYFGKSGLITSQANPTCSIANATGYPSGSPQCLTNQPPPTVPVPDFTTLRNSLITEAGACTAVAPAGTVNVNSITGVPVATLSDNSTKKVICLTAGSTLDIPSGTVLKNTFIIGDTTTTVNVDGGTGSIVAGEANSRLGIKVVSNTIKLDSNDVLTGVNTFIARADTTFSKPASSPDSTSRTLLVTTGDASDLRSFPGNTTIKQVATQAVNASFWNRGSVTLDGGGGLNFTGTIVAGGDTTGVNFNGKIESITQPNGIDNSNIPRDLTSGGFIVMSRK